MSSVEPEQHRDELDRREECAGEFIIAGCYGPESFEFAEEAFDKVSFSIEGEVGFAFDEPVGLGRNDGGNSSPDQGSNQGIGIVSLVCEEGFGIDLLKQRFGLTEVRGLSRRERYGNGIAESIDDDVDLGGQPAPGSANGLAAPPFFRAPALC